MPANAIMYFQLVAESFVYLFPDVFDHATFALMGQFNKNVYNLTVYFNKYLGIKEFVELWFLCPSKPL